MTAPILTHAEVEAHTNQATRRVPRTKESPLNPTVGRIVHYFPKDGTQPLPAIIVRVWSPEMVNLSVFLDGENTERDYPGVFTRDLRNGVSWVTSAHARDGLPAGAAGWIWPPRE